jgi:hypothetical protein
MNFSERRQYEVRRISLPRTRVNKRLGPSFSNVLPIARSWPHRARQERLRSPATSEGPAVLPILTSQSALSIYRAPSPYPPLPALPPVRPHQGRPTRPMRRLDSLPALYTLFAQPQLGDCWISAGGRSRPRTTTPKARVAIGFPPLLHSTAHKRALRPDPHSYAERHLCTGDPVIHRESLRTECTPSRLTQLRKKRNKSKKGPVWRSSTGASGLLKITA